MTNPSNETAPLAELNRTLEYYDRRSTQTKRWYQTLRVLTMVFAAAVPVVSVAGVSSVVTAALGSAIVVTEGLQQLFQFHNRWVGYRTGWNALERERRLYQAGARPYADAKEADQLLAERMERVIESESKDWAVDTAAATGQTSGAVV